ncbi:hypothetical protein HD554DRAFT_1518279 [Boletus coccyginus]|nr:hypothetical protein HD554DRAFT_1518279 [Boletus coccyginus]
MLVDRRRRPVHLSLETFTHAFPLIARFEPTRRSRPNRAIKMPAIIIGSHLDSANYELPLHLVPSADDGGPGTVIVPEAFRTLVLIRFRSEVPVEVRLCTLNFLLAKTPSQNTCINARTSGAMFQSDTTPTMGPSQR